MKETDLVKFNELTLLLDNAYARHAANLPVGERIRLASNEGLIHLNFGNLWYRQHNPSGPGTAPEIESVIITSSVFSAARVNYFDSLDDAIEVVRGWYEYSKEKSQQQAS